MDCKLLSELQETRALGLRQPQTGRVRTEFEGLLDPLFSFLSKNSNPDFALDLLCDLGKGLYHLSRGFLICNRTIHFTLTEDLQAVTEDMR